jgi:Ankyrin repeats (3 copies)
MPSQKAMPSRFHMTTQAQSPSSHLLTILRKDDLDTLQGLVDQRVVSLSAPFESGCSWIEAAALHGATMICRYLLTTKHENYTDGLGDSPLHLASQANHALTCKMLIDMNVGNLESQNTFGRTPLAEACLFGAEDSVGVLLDNFAEVTTQDSQGNSPLHLACCLPNSRIPARLLASKADALIRNDESDTPFHNATYWSDEDTILLLASHSRSELNPVGDMGRSPLHNVAHRGLSDLFNRLVHLGCDPTLRDEWNDTPADLLERACSRSASSTEMERVAE